MNEDYWSEISGGEEIDARLAIILRRLHSGFVEILGDRLDAIYLYGSQARGQARPDSDIDLLIVVNGDQDNATLFDQTLDLAADLSLEFDVVISRAFLSKERFEHEMNPFLMNVRREAVPV